MAGVTRRQVLATSIGTVATGATALGAMSVVPRLLGSASLGAPSTPGTSFERAASAAASSPMVVYVPAGSNSEVQIMVGGRQVTIQDPALVARVVGAAH